MTDNEGGYEDGSGAEDDVGASEITRRMNRPENRPERLAELRNFIRRHRVVPFEIAIAVSVIWSGLFQFFGWTVSAMLFNESLPLSLVVAFNVMYLVSGLALFFGVGWAYRRLEIAGLVLLLTVMVVRSVSILVTAGFIPVTATVLIEGLTLSIACLMRLHNVAKGRSVVLVEAPAQNGEAALSG